MTCNQIQNDRRRLFWVTQPNACGENVDGCGDTCGNMGLQPIDTPQGRTFSTDQYVRGLALNILGTDGRKELTQCGVTPGNRGGYWADSFRKDGGASGSLLRFIKTTGRVREDTALMQAVAQKDLDKLVTLYKVAVSVSVTVTYIGRGTASLVAEIVGRSGETSKVGFIGSRLGNDWVWK